MKAPREDGSSFCADLEQSTLKRPVYEIRTAQNRARSLNGRLHKPLKTEIRHDKINPDPYAKRTAGRVAATPALQSNPVGSASCTPRACACRFWGYLHSSSARAHCAKAGRPAAPHLNLSPSQFPCLTKYTPTPSSGNRFTRTFGSNIQNGSSQMANVPCVIRTRRACWKRSTVLGERDPTKLPLILIASSNRDQTDSTRQLCNSSTAREVVTLFQLAGGLVVTGETNSGNRAPTKNLFGFRRCE